MALSGFDNNWYCSSAQYANVTKWAASTATAPGTIVRQNTTPGVGNERCYVSPAGGTTGSTEPVWTFGKGAKQPLDGSVQWFECTGAPEFNNDVVSALTWQKNNTYSPSFVPILDTAKTHVFHTTVNGTSGTTEPTWNTTAGATTTDNTITWTCCGPVSTYNKWAAPFARLNSATNNIYCCQAAFTYFWVGDDHAESVAASSVVETNGGVCVVTCIDHTVTPPYASSNLRTTASATANSFTGIGASSATSTLYYGINFTTTNGGMSLGVGSYGRCKFDTCTFTNTSNSLSYTQLNSGYAVELTNCQFNFTGTAACTMEQLSSGGLASLRNCSFSFVTQPNYLFYNQNGITAVTPLTLDGCDCSAVPALIGGVTNGITQPSATFKDCKLAVNATAVQANNTALISPAGTVDINHCDSGANVTRNERWMAAGALTTRTDVVRSGGAIDVATPISHRVATSASAASPVPLFHGLPLVVYNGAVGSSKNVTLYGVAFDSRVPNNNEVWFDLEYLGTSGSTLGSWLSGGANPPMLPPFTALTADTSAWDSQASARANSTAYVVGQVFKTASNPGRVFGCIGAGTTASSEPTALAGTSAVLNPSDKSATITLSGGNLTVGLTSGGSAAVRSTQAAGQNKFYFEVTYTNSASGNCAVGIATGTAVLSSWEGSNGLGGFLVSGNAGQLCLNGSLLGISIGAIVNGDVLCFAIDKPNNLVWARRNNGNWNNSATANPATGVGGIDISSVFANAAIYAAVGMSNVAAIAIANFGASSFAQTAPSGFVSGVPTTGYATAVDGDAISDGTALVRTGCRFRQALAFTPQVAAPIYVHPRFGKPSTTYFIDPLIKVA